MTGLVWAACAESALANAGMQVLQQWNLGGAGGWDYLALDSAGKRLFVSRATRVDVIDTSSGK